MLFIYTEEKAKTEPHMLTLKCYPVKYGEDALWRIICQEQQPEITYLELDFLEIAC